MFQVYCRTPTEATEIERQSLVRLVVEGGAVSADVVRNGMARAEMLVFCAHGGDVVGVAALKVPQPGYREGLERLRKAGVALPEARYPFELGYVAVDARWRGRFIGPFLCSQVVFLARGRGLFATTGADSMRDRILPQLDFGIVGASWQGKSEPLNLMLREPMTDH